MIENPNQDGPSVEGDTKFAQEIKFELPASAPALKFKPIADYLQLDVPKTREHGGIIVPGMPKSQALITATVIANGPECKMVKAGDTVVMVAAGIMGGAQGSMLDGQRVFWTQEKYLLAVLAE